MGFETPKFNCTGKRGIKLHETLYTSHRPYPPRKSKTSQPRLFKVCTSIKLKVAKLFANNWTSDHGLPLDIQNELVKYENIIFKLIERYFGDTYVETRLRLIEINISPHCENKNTTIFSKGIATELLKEKQKKIHKQHYELIIHELTTAIDTLIELNDLKKGNIDTINRYRQIEYVHIISRHRFI